MLSWQTRLRPLPVAEEGSSKRVQQHGENEWALAYEVGTDVCKRRQDKVYRFYDAGSFAF